MSGPSIYELNRMVDAWDEQVRCPYIKAEGGTWLAAMATLIGERVRTIKVSGIPRPAVPYRGVWFVNLSKEDIA